MTEHTPSGPAGRTQRACLITADADLAKLLPGLWPQGDVAFTVYDRGRAAVEVLFNDPPDLLVVDKRMDDLPASDIAAFVKGENVYRQVPVVLVLDEADMAEPMDWNALEVDDFLVRPFTDAEARDRLNLTLLRAMRAMDANPLTKLPGNTSIIQRIQQRMDRGEDFALAYLDLDHFKAYNDRYGFSRGDEALMMAARVIVNTVKGLGEPGAFVGHVGGDDFVFLMGPEHWEEACTGIIRTFDAIVPNFYDQGDREAGRIRSVDRQGNARDFPIMAISIAVVLNEDGRLKHYGEATAIASGLKKKAKENPESCYVADRRKS